MGFPAKDDPTKTCEMCGEPLTRKRFASGRLEDRGVFLRRKFCSQSCANTRTEITRSGHAYRAKAYKKATCEECGGRSRLHVHHHDRNWRNDAPANLVTLCASCHLKLHWREDREARVAAIHRGVSTRQRSAAGKAS